MENKRIEQLKSFLKQTPDDPFLKYAIGLEYVSGEETDEAENWFQRVVEEHPDYVPVYYQYAHLLISQGKEQEAIIIAKKGIELAQKSKDLKAVLELIELMEEIEG